MNETQLIITTDTASHKVATSNLNIGPMVARIESRHMHFHPVGRRRKSFRAHDVFAVELYFGTIRADLQALSSFLTIKAPEFDECMDDVTDDRDFDLAAKLGLTDTTINEHLAAHVQACMDRAAALCAI